MNYITRFISRDVNIGWFFPRFLTKSKKNLVERLCMFVVGSSRGISKPERTWCRRKRVVDATSTKQVALIDGKFAIVYHYVPFLQRSILESQYGCTIECSSVEGKPLLVYSSL
jgi:hypothetical protein